VQSGAAVVPLVVVAVVWAFGERFAGWPQRVDERRAAWRRWAASHGLRLTAVALEGFDAALSANAPPAAATP
jgi:hypothetical protein